MLGYLTLTLSGLQFFHFRRISFLFKSNLPGENKALKRKKKQDLLYLFLFSEIEAKEACDWLRAAGFPQYAQLFKSKHLFPKLFVVINCDNTHPLLTANNVLRVILFDFPDCHIPIDTDWAKSDHEFLDSDTLDSLCR